MYEQMTECNICEHDLEEYKDREEWVCCPFCGFVGELVK